MVTMIITIDGPAGVGKSTVAMRLANRLGFEFLDTGAMYRAVTWAALQKGVDLKDHDAVARIAASIEIHFDADQVLVDGQDVTSEIRSADVTAGVSEVADNPKVRHLLVAQQREMTAAGNFVCEGRDQGTVAFPNAECKIFLTATAAARAKRRFQQLRAAGAETDYHSILMEQTARDLRDTTRPVGRLSKADDAVEFETDGKSLEQVVDELETFARSCL